MPPCWRFSGHIKLAGQTGADRKHSWSLMGLYIPSGIKILQEKVKKMGVLESTLLSFLPEQGPKSKAGNLWRNGWMDVLFLISYTALYNHVLMYSQTSMSRYKIIVVKAKVAFTNLWQVLSDSRHNTMLEMQQNSRSIATAASLFICRYDMWVWWDWLSGCMTAKSVLLNTVIVSKSSCVGPWHNQKILKCVPFFRVQLLCGRY